MSCKQANPTESLEPEDCCHFIQVYRIVYVATGYSGEQPRNFKNRNGKTILPRSRPWMFPLLGTYRNVKLKSCRGYYVYLHVFVPWVKSYRTYLVQINLSTGYPPDSAIQALNNQNYPVGKFYPLDRRLWTTGPWLLSASSHSFPLMQHFLVEATNQQSVPLLLVNKKLYHSLWANTVSIEYVHFYHYDQESQIITSL